MLGNAVPSLIAEVLAREIRRQFFDAPLKTPLKLLPPNCAKVPPPAHVARLPKKYHEHIGRHERTPARARRLAVKLRRKPKWLCNCLPYGAPENHIPALDTVARAQPSAVSEL